MFDNYSVKIYEFLLAAEDKIKNKLLVCRLSDFNQDDGIHLLICVPDIEEANSLFRLRKALERAAQNYSRIHIMSKTENETFYRSFPVRKMQLYLPTIMPQISNQINARALKYSNLLQAIADTSVAVSLHDASEKTEYQFLDIVSNTPQRLNKQKPELVGKPVFEVDRRISEPRAFYIKKTLETGLTQSFEYTYEDSHLWRFKCSVGFIPGSNEVIVITQDLESWQPQYWINKIVEESESKRF